MTDVTPLVYLAHPIDFNGYSPPAVDYIRQCLVQLGFAVYTPSRAFSAQKGAPPNPQLQRINNQALDRCDAIVAVRPESKTIGVPMELQRAVLAGKPALVMTEGEASWVLAELADAREVRIARPPGENSDYQWLVERVGDHLIYGEPLVNVPLKVKLEPDACLPTRAYPDDCGFDLYTVGNHSIKPGEFVDVPVGCAVELPEGVWGLMVGRSSTLRKHELMVNPGIIDTGYRGPLYAGVRNLGPDVFEATEGMRLAQLIPLPNLATQLDPIQVRQLSDSKRGQSGFGSSGE